MKIRFLGLASLVIAFGACDAPMPTDLIEPAVSLAKIDARTCVLANGSVVATGRDDFGYNRCAGVFSGPADGVDKKLDGKVWGDPTYANDHLKMKWNASWDACNANRNPENCAGAWTDNQWNGNVPGGSGEMWHYKITWAGPCGVAGASTGDGGYCIWNEYEVVMSHGTVANQHFWDAHANPAGYGN